MFQTEFRAAIERRRIATGVHVLSPPLESDYYESALVFGLPTELSQFVEAQRKKLGIVAPDVHICAPHLTVLFVGRHPRSATEWYSAAVEALSPATASVAFGELDVFVVKDRIVNVHIAVSKSQGLREQGDRIKTLMKSIR